jgi:undecaprenyl-diphosphatase
MPKRGIKWERSKQGRHLSFLQLVVLAAVQGITEFLPISSSGHLILASDLANWPDQTLKFDIAVHIGTLGAVMLYFWRDLWTMVSDTLRPPRRRASARRPGRQLAFYLLVGTVPVLIAGALVHLYAGDVLRNPTLIAITTLVFGVLLWLADRFGITVHRIEHMTLGSALFIGISQMLAIIPGTSRAGITMTAARIAGFERIAAARFSMLLSIPAIIAAGAVAGWNLHQAGDAQVTADAAIAAALSFAIALLAIWFLMQFVRRMSFTPFVIYRLALGGGLLVWLYI